MTARDGAPYDDLFVVPALEAPPPERAGDWLLGPVRARGGFASVHRARHVDGDREAAVKVLDVEVGADPRARLRFRREVDTLRALRHPNLVELYDAGELADGRLYYAMEWLDGRTAAEERLARGPFTLAEARDVLGGVGAALATTHAAGVVHRDVKAQNVMLLPPGAGARVKLLDFGIAKLLGDYDAPAGGFTTSSMLGTPTSMAPEQILGEPVDPRTDVYALGVLLYELLTARPPFRAQSAVELQEQHLFSPPPRAGEVCACPPAVDEVIRRCLAKSREERYPTVDAFLGALDDALHAEAPADARVDMVALCVVAGVDAGDDPDDAALDDLERVIALADDTCRAAGLELALRCGNAVLALAPLPPAPEAAAAVRAAALRTALALRVRLDARDAPSPRVRTAATVHTGHVQRAARPDAAPFAGGDLLNVADWAAQPAADAVLATPSALAGLSVDSTPHPTQGHDPTLQLFVIR